MTGGECNCPPICDVFRYGVGTKEPCPVHPPPPNLVDIAFIPPFDGPINAEPLRAADTGGQHGDE